MWRLSATHVKMFNPPGSEGSREVANLTWRKNHPPPHKWCQRICMSVRLSLCDEFWPQLSQDWWNRMGYKSAIFLLSCASPKNCFSKFFSFNPHEFKNGNHFKKNLATLAATAVFASPFLPPKQPFSDFEQKKLPKLTLFAGGVWNLPHKFHLYFIIILFFVPENYLCKVGRMWLSWSRCRRGGGHWNKTEHVIPIVVLPCCGEGVNSIKFLTCKSCLNTVSLSIIFQNRKFLGLDVKVLGLSE